MNWLMPPEAGAQAQALADSLRTSHSFPLALADILVRRGFSDFEQTRTFFSPKKEQLLDPMLLKDMDKAVKRLTLAKEKGEKILVYGDYDVDGTTAVTLMTLFLESFGVDIAYYIPDRYTEGYGLSYKGVEYAAEQQATILLCLDCGIKAHTQVRHANQKGIDVIICDHHKPGETMPEALAILDPQRPDCEYPEQVLTGCGVGFKLCQALHEVWKEEGNAIPDPFDAYADLITLSIASDIVPITGENRLIAFFGLQKVRNNPLPGIRAIMDLAQGERSWSISDLVFFVGPHVNAAGRLHHAMAAVDVMRGKDKNLTKMVEALGKANTDRKEIDKRITNEALDLIGQDTDFDQRNTTVLYQEDWHKGVIGIVASRLIENHYRPTVLFTKSENKLVGSARSVSKFNLYDALEACEEHVLQFGGHAYAAGISLEEAKFPDFAAAFEREVKKRIQPEHLVPSLHIDGVLQFGDIDARFIRLIERMEPFGPGNRRPVFIASDVEVIDMRRLKESHVRLTLRQGGQVFSAIGFNLYRRWEEVNALRIDIAFQPVFNIWKENVSINLQLKDIRPAL
ncbi:MAG: single-stranded-DNA-specific exonuclease RecJ [Bacteroidia bacterium]